MKKLSLLTCLIFLFVTSFSQTSYVWNGSTSTNWNTNTNWTPNGIPGTIDNVTIVTGSNNCLLPANITITNLTITSGLLNLNGFTINTTGVIACNSGSCINGTFNSTATTLTFAGTTFGANITATVSDVYFNGSIFNGNVTVTKTSASNIGSTGNNVFNGVTSITNSGTGYLLLTNGGVGRNETFNGLTSLNTTNTGGLYIGYGQSVALNANLTINNTSSTGLIQIGRVGTVSLNSGVTITCGTFAGANLNLYKIVQTGSTAQSLSPGNAGAVNIYGSNMTGALTINAGIITAQTSTFSAAVNYNMTGSTGNCWSSGGNTYNGILTVNNSSSGYIGFANGTADIYIADVYANNTSATGGRIIFGNNCTSQFNGNIYVSQSGTTNASGIAIGWGGTFPVINLASGKNILVNGTFSSGYLQILKMQAAVTSAINLTVTGTSNVQLNNNTFNGIVNVTAPDIYPYGGTYNAPVSFIKTAGGTGNHNSSNLNIFNSTLSIENQSNTGYFLLGYQSADQFNDNITVTSSGTGGISFGWNGGTGTPVLASGKTISIGAGGYSAGFLQFGSFTQLGSATPINLTLTGMASLEVYKNTISTTFNSAFTVTAPDIYLRGGTFNGTAEFTKTGGTSNHNNGNQNIFNSTCTINQQSTIGYFMLGYNSNDLFNGDIVVTNTGNQGIYFGWSSGTGTPTQATGRSITVGVAGFSGGSLNFNTFTQLGNSPVNLNFTGTSTTLLFARNSVFNGVITSVTPSVFFNGCVFNGIVNSTKTGSNNDGSSGGNTFNGTSTFANNSSGYLLLGNSNADVWNADVTFNNNGTSYIYPCWNSVGNLFNGNINFSSTAGALGIQFCGNTTATATMSAGYGLTSGSYNGGYLILQRFTQLGTVPTNLTLNSTATYLQYGPSSVLGGNVTSVSPGLFFNGCTFNGASTCTKNGSSGDFSQGGNVFNGLSNITNSGSSYLLLGNTNPDTWNSDVTFTDNGSERLLPCWATVGNLFNGNIYLNTSGSALGIQFCGGNATATATLAATKTIAAGSTGLNAGYLQLKQFTQLGSAPINLTMGSTGTYIQYGPLSNLGGNVISSSPGLYFNGCKFNGTLNSTKTGTSSDASIGSNIFNGTSSLTNIGSGYLLLGNSNADVWNADVTFNNNGTSYIYPCWNSVGNLFNGNINFSSTSGALGIQFCGNTTATATMSAGYGLTSGSYNGGYLILQRFTQLGTVPTNLTLNSTATYLQYGPSSVLGGNVTSVSPGLFFNGCTFNGTSTCTKNGSSGDFSQGGNVFNGLSNITNSGSSYLLLGNTNPDTWNSDVTFTNNGSERLLPCWATVGNLFNGNIFVNTSGSALGIQFCGGNATATATLAATKTIAAGSTGLNAGYLQLKQFTQLGSAPINLTIASTGTYIQYGPLSNLGGNVISSSPGLYFNGCKFNGTLNSTKTGTSSDAGIGNNIFYGTSSLTNIGSGYLLLGNGNADIWNADVTFNNNGTSYIYPCWNSAGNLFNGNINFNSTAGALGIQFCGNTTATATMSAGYGLTSGSYNGGYLILQRFTQLGTVPTNLTLNSTATYLQYGPSSVLGGNVTSVSPGLFFNGCTFNGTSTCTKNGTTNDNSNGNNIFNGTSINNNTGSGYLLFGNGNADQFNTTATFNNLGSSHIYVAYNSINNIFGGVTTFNNAPTSTGSWIYIATTSANNATFNDNIIVNCNNGAGIYFGNSTGVSTLSAGKTISIGAGGFNAGQLVLKQFTQVSATPQNLTTTGTSFIQYGPSSSFDGNVTSVSPGLFFNGCTFNGTSTCTKNGTTNDNSNGNNIFNGTSIMNNIGSGYLLFGNGNRDQFNTTATFNNLGSSHIYVAYNSINNIFGGVTTFNNAPTSTGSWIYIATVSANNSTFNDNIIVNCNNGAGIYFGNSTGASTLSAGKTISIGAGGFNAGQLVLKQFTQVSATPQNLTTTGTSFIQYGPSSSFDGNVTSVSPGLFFNTSVFNGVVNSTKNGTTNDVSPGGNTFNGSTSLINVSTGAFYMANSTSDAYNGNVIFAQNNTGIFYPNHNTNCTYAGNITVNSTGTYTITFGQAGGGIATLTGGAAQTINKTGSVGNPVFTRLVINKSVSDVTLNTRTNVSTYLTLTQGIINTSQTNILNMNNASSSTTGNALSFINGPMNYDMALNGSRTLNFPVGKIGPVLSGTNTITTSDWRPAILTVNHNSGTSYTYNTELFISSANALAWTMPPTVSNVSRIHWWDIARSNTSTGVITPTLNLNGNQIITLFYDVNDGVTDPTNLTVCKNTYTATTAWKDIGGAGAIITTGNVTSTSAPTAFNSFSRFTLGNRIGGVNPLPIELLSFIATPINKQVDLTWVTASETNNDHFEIERSIDGINFEYVTKVKAYGNGNSSIKQTYNALDENPYKGLSYYRLKQIDKTSDFKYANIVSIDLKENSYINIYPNPATDKLYINASNNYNNSTIKIISATGIEVKSAQQLISHNGTIDLADLASGIYFIVVNNDTSIQNIKISIQK